LPSKKADIIIIIIIIIIITINYNYTAVTQIFKSVVKELGKGKNVNFTLE
jgi:hypothetical protein